MSEPVQLLCGDVCTVLAGFEPQFVHCVITSPPYWGLRAYNGGSEEIGQEKTIDDYVRVLVEVFGQVKRVLRDDGTLWAVLGDRYGPQKQLQGVPWRVAFALQDAGWTLRQEICWAKSNPMPESVKDRCTRAHETVFMLAKGPRYYYDQDAIREPQVAYAGPDEVRKRVGAKVYHTGNSDPFGGGFRGLGGFQRWQPHTAGRNKRSVWTVAGRPCRARSLGITDVDHYAAFPPELVRPMVRAGCPPDGVVLDPFAGACTTALVALQEGRRAIMIDLNADYLRLGEVRLRHELGFFYGAPGACDMTDTGQSDSSAHSLPQESRRADTEACDERAS